MDSSFAVLLAPLGCFSSSRGRTTFQRDNQAYLRSPTHDDHITARRSLVSKILRARRLGPDEVAEISAYFYRFERADAWHDLTAERKVAKVKLFYGNVIRVASGLKELMAQ